MPRMKPAKNTICLWYDGDAEEAARFYARTFPDSSVGAAHRAPGDFPSGKQGDVLMVEFTDASVTPLFEAAKAPSCPQRLWHATDVFADRGNATQL